MVVVGNDMDVTVMDRITKEEGTSSLECFLKKISGFYHVKLLS
jgi:hypothetical protein